MVGVLELIPGRGRRPRLEAGDLPGLPCLRAAVPIPPRLKERRAARRVGRAARMLADAGVRRVLTAADFPHWDLLAAAGLRPVDPGPFCQALAVPLTLAALARQGRRPEEARVLLAGRRVSPALFRAAEILCPRVRALAVDAGEEGEELAAWLRAEFGAAVLPPGGETDVALRFDPGEAEGRTALRLYGPAPDLAGLRPVPVEGGLPAGLDRLPLLALLWETGRLGLGRLEVSDGQKPRIDLTEGVKLHIISY